MAKESTLSLVLKVDDQGTVVLDKFTKQVQKTSDDVSRMTKAMSIVSAAAMINIGQQAINATKQIYGMARSIASLANDIERNASVVGLSITEYQKWTYAAKMADVESESLMMGIKFLSRNLEDANRGIGDAKNYFDALGIKGKTVTEVMLELADKFKGAGSSSEQAARKIDYAMAIAGRGGMALIPLWNLGREGIKKYMDEAVRLGSVLGDVVVEKGSEAENQFKRLEAQVNATRLSLAPAALAFANFFSDIIKDAKKTVEAIGGIVGAISESAKKSFEAQEEWRKKRGYPAQDLGLGLGIRTPSGMSTPGEEAERYKGRLASFTEKPLPVIGKGESEYPEWRKIIGEERVQQEKDYWEAVKRTWEIEDKLKGIEMERAQVLSDDMFPSIEAVNKMTEEATAWGEKLRLKLIEIRDLTKDFGVEDYASGFADASNDATRALNQMALASQKTSKETGKFWDDLGKDISSAWASNMVNIIRSSGSASDKIKSFFQSIGDVFLSTVSKMISQWLIFDSLTKSGSGWGTGEQKGYGGLLGFVGGLLGGVGGAVKHEGGIVGELGPTRSVPAAAFAFAPRFHGGFAPNEYPAILNRGEGVFTPAQMKALGKTGDDESKTTNFFIYAMDPMSFRDFINRNPSAIVEVIHKDTRSRGATRSDMKRYS